MRGKKYLKIKRISVILFFLCFIPSFIFAFCYEEAGHEYGINPLLLKAISETESNQNPAAINTNANGTKDTGLMQINSFWIKRLNLNYSRLLSDPCYNVETGAHILRKCIDRYGFNWQAIGCYNAVSKNKQIKYSWRIFKKLKSSELRVRDPGSGDNSNSLPKVPNSEFFFSVRDRINDK